MKLTHNASAWAAGLGMAVLAFATPLQAQLVTNGGFETGNFSGWFHTGMTAFDFVTTAPCVGSTLSSVHSGTYGTCLGPDGANGFLIQQVIGTTPGHTYDFDFWLQHAYSTSGPGVAFAAYWGDTPIYSSTGGFFAYAEQGADVVAILPATQLSFVYREDPHYWSLDDISVVDLGVVPEPTSIVLLGSGLVGLAGIVRRRRKTL
jgi:Carbohydrate binding domain/PEP-CTERM motif